MTEVSISMRHLSETEKNAVRKALVEERSRFCTFASCLKPFLDEEIGLVTELQQLEEVNKKLARHTNDPFKLPPASEQVRNSLMSFLDLIDFETVVPPSTMAY